MTIIILSLLLFFFILYILLFYPCQKIKNRIHIVIKIPEDKYHDDCLHPCVRYIPDGFQGYNWWMVQSPYYNRDVKLENPILFFSKDKNQPINWEFQCVVNDTPAFGHNSDPNLFFENGKLWVIWRECYTPLCKKIGVDMVTVGVFTLDGNTFCEPKIFLSQKEAKSCDTQQCPILIKIENKYFFYTVNYQYKPVRKNIGVAIWESDSLVESNFIFRKNCIIPDIYICDKFKQLYIWRKILFLPKPLKHDLWHFDLFLIKDKLYMVSVAEWGR